MQESETLHPKEGVNVQRRRLPAAYEDNQLRPIKKANTTANC